MDSKNSYSGNGTSNTGYSNGSYSKTGYSSGSYSNTGSANTGYSNGSYSNTGSANTGYSNGGYSNTGYSNNGYASNGGYSNGGYAGGGYGGNYQQNQPYDYGYQGEQPVSIGNWIGTMLLCCIPLVNFILIIVWAASERNRSKKNWAIATLILMAIAFVLSFALVAIVGASAASVLNSLY